MTFGTGQVLGNYRLIRLLGRGGFAEVYLAEHIYLKTHVAIKVLRMQLTDDDIEHFGKEARIIASLNHPHILRVFDFGIERGTPYLVMDYAPNGTLRQRHPKGSLLPLDTIILYFKQVASALQHIHDKKLIHRDIKPENLLIGSSGEILISDFGIAVMAHSTQSLDTGNAYGTIHYMAPEQIQGKPRFASDQYALGIIIYEWLCGTPPFKGTALEIGMQHLVTSPQPLNERLSTISREVAQVVLTALVKDPHQRYENVQAFADALEQVSSLPKVRVISTYIDPSSTTKKVTWSPDSQCIASTSGVYWEGGGAIQVWNVIYETKIYAHEFDHSVVNAVIWIANILHIASAETKYRGKLQIFNTLSEKEINVFSGWFSQIVDISWSPDGKFIAIVLGSNKYINNGPEELPDFDGFSIDSIEVRNTATGAVIGQDDVYSDGYDITYVWSPDSKYIAFSIDDGTDTVTIWKVDIDNDTIIHYKGRFERIIAWSPNGKFIASGDYREINIWDPLTGNEVFTYQNHTTWITAIAWSPDSKYIVSACGERQSNDNMIYIWDTATGENIYSYISKSGTVESIAWSLDGTRIAIAFENEKIEVWDVR